METGRLILLPLMLLAVTRKLQTYALVVVLAGMRTICETSPVRTEGPALPICEEPLLIELPEASRTSSKTKLGSIPDAPDNLNCPIAVPPLESISPPPLLEPDVNGIMLPITMRGGELSEEPLPHPISVAAIETATKILESFLVFPLVLLQKLGCD